MGRARRVPRARAPVLRRARALGRWLRDGDLVARWVRDYHDAAPVMRRAADADLVEIARFAWTSGGTVSIGADARDALDDPRARAALAAVVRLPLGTSEKIAAFWSLVDELMTEARRAARGKVGKVDDVAR